MDSQQTGDILPQKSDETDDIEIKMSKLPADVLEWFYSTEIANNVGETAKRFNISKEKIPLLAQIVGLVILKDIPLNNLSTVLGKNFPVDEEVARQIAIEIAIKQFLPIRSHLTDTENFIRLLGGQLPQVMPSLPQRKKDQPFSSPSPATAAPPPETIVQTDVATAINERPEIANQNITEKPLKLSDSEGLRLPNIKNWLTDWRQYKGRFPQQDIALSRMKYLYEGSNGKNLNEAERVIVGALLKSLDEYTRLPFSQKTGLLLTNKLLLPENQATGAVKLQPVSKIQAAPPAPTPTPTPPTPPRSSPPPPITPPPVRPAPPRQTSPPSWQAPRQIVLKPPAQPPTPPPSSQTSYKEPIDDQDLAGPQGAQKATPLKEGNTIDLRGTGSQQ